MKLSDSWFMSDFSEIFFLKYERKRILRSFEPSVETMKYKQISILKCWQCVELYYQWPLCMSVFWVGITHQLFWLHKTPRRLFTSISSDFVRSALYSNLGSIILTIIKNLDSDALFGVRRLQRQPILSLRLQRFETSHAQLLLAPRSREGENARAEGDTRIFAVLLITWMPSTWAKSVFTPSRLSIDKLLNNVYNSNRNNEMKLYEIVTDPSDK